MWQFCNLWKRNRLAKARCPRGKYEGASSTYYFLFGFDLVIASPLSVAEGGEAISRCVLPPKR